MSPLHHKEARKRSQGKQCVKQVLSKPRGVCTFHPFWKADNAKVSVFGVFSSCLQGFDLDLQGMQGPTVDSSGILYIPHPLLSLDPLVLDDIHITVVETNICLQLLNFNCEHCLTSVDCNHEQFEVCKRGGSWRNPT